ncbi:Protein DENND6B [Nymphon striatum]|nr:Protein DENND6B [Nymphon striatum]
MEVDNDNLEPALAGKLSPESQLRPTVLPWDKFSQWLHCICVVTFDLELGQAMEKMNICYLSFPDSNSGCMGDTQFHFRIRQCPGNSQMCHRNNIIPAHAQYNQDCPAPLQVNPSYYYGYVYFRQVKDKSLRRGYFQKSVVLVTRLPFIQLFSHLVRIISPDYFDNGEPSIEAAEDQILDSALHDGIKSYVVATTTCHDIDQWPPAEPGSTLNLPLLGNVIQIRVPCKLDKLTGQNDVPSKPQPSFPAPLIIPSVHDVDIFRSFHPVLSHIHLLWELVIIGEPIVVMASSPNVCSEMVQSLVSSCIWPLMYCADYRPFFTIHDSEFKEYTTKTQAPPPVILGVTNPFFAKTLQHWPHVIRIGENISTSSTNTQKHKIKKGGNLKTLDSKPGVYTRYKPFLQKDKHILKRIYKGIQLKRPPEVQSAMLRRHLLELTQSFMIPLERYVASLMPLQRNISPFKGTPVLRPFNPEEFLQTLDNAGPHLTSGIKGDWAGLYKRFFRTVNFGGWYNTRHKEVSQKLQALHIEALGSAVMFCGQLLFIKVKPMQAWGFQISSDLILWIKDKEEVEVVDLILKLKNKLEAATNDNLVFEDDVVSKLQNHMDEIINTLPDDLKSVLRKW